MTKVYQVVSSKRNQVINTRGSYFNEGDAIKHAELEQGIHDALNGKDTGVFFVIKTIDVQSEFRFE